MLGVAEVRVVCAGRRLHPGPLPQLGGPHDGARQRGPAGVVLADRAGGGVPVGKECDRGAVALVQADVLALLILERQHHPFFLALRELLIQPALGPLLLLVLEARHQLAHVDLHLPQQLVVRPLAVVFVPYAGGQTVQERHTDVETVADELDDLVLRQVKRGSHHLEAADAICPPHRHLLVVVASVKLVLGIAARLRSKVRAGASRADLVFRIATLLRPPAHDLDEHRLLAAAAAGDELAAVVKQGGLVHREEPLRAVRPTEGVGVIVGAPPPSRPLAESLTVRCVESWADELAIRRHGRSVD